MFLKRDTVVASKGGDNFLTNTSIKSNQASLYSYDTISQQLMLIYMMLESKDPVYIQNQVKYLFLDESDKSLLLKQDLEKVAREATSKLLFEIERSLTIN